MEGSKEAAYKPFARFLKLNILALNVMGRTGVTEIVSLSVSRRRLYAVTSKSDENGFVYVAAVSQEEEMVT